MSSMRSTLNGGLDRQLPPTLTALQRYRLFNVIISIIEIPNPHQSRPRVLDVAARTRFLLWP